MVSQNAEALALKKEGNTLFARKDYLGAESYYSRALILDPTMITLYTNRAMARFNLGNHDGVVSDCHACIANSSPASVKAHYFLSKSLSALGDHETASAQAEKAYTVCRDLNEDKSLTMTHDWVLQCRKERWTSSERARRRQHRDLENEVMDLLARDRDEMLRTGGGESGGDGDQAIVYEESEKKMAQMRDIFERARAHDDRDREVPEWLMDDITFDVMTDPVITQSGRSYERSSIISAIASNSIDPVTRQSLTKDELRPNLALRQACEWYLSKNGWAYDW